MSTDTKLEFITTNTEQTEHLGELLGAKLRGGEVIVLSSDLGGGKTTLTRGLARGAKSHDTVSSPSFTISKDYNTANFLIKHYDFYRLQDAGLMMYDLQENINHNTVCVIEWADVVAAYLPKEYIKIIIENVSDESRRINLNLPLKYEYLTQDINLDDFSN